MSRPLPNRPDLEHLRKQAKDMLREMKPHGADSQLADAQRAVAREYGFASWPALKAQVESMSAAMAASPGTPPAGPLAGRWTLDIARSTRHPDNPVLGARLHFEVRHDTVTIRHLGTDAEGRKQQGEHTIPTDGEEHAVAGAAGYTLRASWDGARALETVATRDGNVVGRGRYEVSADGLSLTVSSRDASANAHGWRSEADQRLVFVRA